MTAAEQLKLHSFSSTSFSYKSFHRVFAQDQILKQLNCKLQGVIWGVGHVNSNSHMIDS